MTPRIASATENTLSQKIRADVVAELGAGEEAETEIEYLNQQNEERLDILEARLALLKEHMQNLGCDCEALERAVYEKLCTETATTSAFRDAGRVAAPSEASAAPEDPFMAVNTYEYTEDASTMTARAKEAKVAAERALGLKESAKLSDARSNWGKVGGGRPLTLNKFRQMSGGAGGCVIFVWRTTAFVVA